MRKSNSTKAWCPALVIGSAMFSAIHSGNSSNVTASPTPTDQPRVALDNASKDHPWENSLGMKFVPVPGTQVLFSIWDTRVQDFGVYGQERGDPYVSQTYVLGKEGWKEGEASWRHPRFEQGPTHPVVDVDWNAANDFSSWLTEREHANGTLPKQKAYRLPKDDEWSIAVGLNQETGNSPDEKSGKIEGVYPWGTDWPPPKGAGNFSGEEAKTGNEPADWTAIRGYHDGWPRTSPVGSYRANKFGLYDMAGNVWQVLNEARGHIGELKPLADKQSSYAKTSGYLVDAQSGLNQIVKRDELVSRVHRDSDRVLS